MDKRWITKIILFSVLILFLGTAGIFIFANLILEMSWLFSQKILSSIIRLLLLHWISIPLFGLIMGVLSILHTLYGPPAERSIKFLIPKTLLIIFLSMGAEYVFRITETGVFALLAGQTNKIDPLFRVDMAFFLFWLPFIKKASLFFLGYSSILFLCRMLTSPKELDKINLIFMLFFGSLTIILFRLQIVVSGIDGYLGYPEVYGTLLPFTLSVLVVLLFLILAVAFFGFSSRFTAVGSIIVSILFICANMIYPVVLQKIIFSPNQSTLQEKFAGYHADSTRKAFALDSVVRDEPLVVSETNFKEVIFNTFWNDRDHFLKAVQKNQEIFPIFNIRKAFPLLQKDISNHIHPYFITAREVDQNPNDLWDVRHFRNIFGYGAIIGSASKFDGEGYPELILKDLNLHAKDSNFSLNKPYIFFSDSFSNFVFINTSMLLPDFSTHNATPIKQKFPNVRSIKMNILLKIALAIKNRDYRFLLTEYIEKDTELIYKRNPTHMIQTILPFFEYSAPTLIIHNGELWWNIAAYSASKSVFTAHTIKTPWGQKNWLRSPLRVFINAYSGEMKFNITDSDDPHMKIVKALFPKLFDNSLDLPQEKEMYPEILFDIQSQIFTVYHETNAASFYAGLNKRSIASALNTNVPENVKNFVFNNRLAFQRVYVPEGKNIYAAQIVAYMNDSGGKVVHLSEVSPNTGVAGLAQAEAFLNQDPNYSRLATLWDQRGSIVSSSDTIFYPTETGGIYLRTIFLESESISIPLATRFALINNTKIELGMSPLEIAGEGLQIIGAENSPLFSEEDRLRQIIRDAYRLYLDAEASRLDGNTQEYRQNVDKIAERLQSVSN